MYSFNIAKGLTFPLKLWARNKKYLPGGKTIKIIQENDISFPECRFPE